MIAAEGGGWEAGCHVIFFMTEISYKAYVAPKVKPSNISIDA